MAPSVAQCDEMIAACRQAGVQLAVVKTERYRRVTMRAKQLIDAGRIGPIHMLRTISCFLEALGREILESRPWYADPAGGGLFMSMASHNADMLLWLTGLRAQQVFAQASTFGASGVPAQSVMAQIVFERGVMGHVDLGRDAAAEPAQQRGALPAGGRAGDHRLRGLRVPRPGGRRRLGAAADARAVRLHARPRSSPVRLELHIGVLQGFIDGTHERRQFDVPGTAGRAAVAIHEACGVRLRRARLSMSRLG
ncbi:MAG: hypothetical protein U0Z44_07965 [Kouleothrix sp.]